MTPKTISIYIPDKYKVILTSIIRYCHDCMRINGNLLKNNGTSSFYFISGLCATFSMAIHPLEAFHPDFFMNNFFLKKYTAFFCVLQQWVLSGNYEFFMTTFMQSKFTKLLWIFQLIRVASVYICYPNFSKYLMELFGLGNGWDKLVKC